MSLKRDRFRTESTIEEEEGSDSGSDKAAKSRVEEEESIRDYVPKQFQDSGSAPKPKPTSRTIRFDSSQLNSCGAYSQIFVLISSLLIILIIILNGCQESADEKTYSSDSSVNTTVTNSTTTTTTTEEPTKKPEQLNCFIYYYFIIICIIAANVELFSLMFYSFHLVEAFTTIPWLVIEGIFYVNSVLQFFFMAVWMASIGNYLKYSSILAFIDSILVLILAINKLTKYKSGRPAQFTSNDPDGNIFRQHSPNYKFTKPDPKAFELELKKEKSDSF